ncbi:MAG: hypothetical protein ACKO2G_15575 [Verrucomicrobiales bacterium]
MKTTLIASAILATLVFIPTSAEAGSRSRSYGGYCPPPVVVPPSRCYTPPPPVYYRPNVVGYGWGHPVPSRTVTRCDTTVYRSYNAYGSGYIESRETYCRPVVTPRPVYVVPNCGPTYYRPAPAPCYRGSYGSISIRF